MKGIAKSGWLKGSAKALGPVGAGLSYYNNYHEAKDSGLSTEVAATKATVDTAVTGAVQAASVALFTVAIPIPGVGTVVGVGLGLAINHFLNKRSKDEDGIEKKDSQLDKLKGIFKWK